MLRQSASVHLRSHHLQTISTVRIGQEADSAEQLESRAQIHSLFAGTSILAKNDVSLGDSGSHTVVAAPAPGQKTAFKLQGIVSEEMFAVSGK